MKNLSLSEEVIIEGFKKICHSNDLLNKIGKRFIVDDVDVAIFKIDNDIFAVSNICPHQHSPLIYDSFVEDECVVCPAHGWMFNIRTGKTPMGYGGLEIFEVKIIDEYVYAKVTKKNFNW
jgi:nitrite reductase/ring-hydroxylating ferredoxin subunit